MSKLEENIALIFKEKDTINSTVDTLVKGLIGTSYSNIQQELDKIDEYLSTHQYVAATIGNTPTKFQSSNLNIHTYCNKNISVVVYVNEDIIYNAFVRNYVLPNIRQWLVSQSKRDS